MARFSLFRTPKPNQFNFIPRHYDPEKEELYARVNAAKPKANTDAELDNSPEAIRARMQMGFRSGRQSIDRKFKRKMQTRSNYRVAWIALVLTAVAAVFIWRNLESILALMQESPS